MSMMNVRHYNEVVAKGHFRKVYPLLAQKVLDCTGVSFGHCIDLGGGPGMFGIELARLTTLHVTVIDPNPECLEVARENIIEHGLIERMDTQLGAAENMQQTSNSIDLVISRGSIPFWQDPQQGIAEIFRVLRPGGWAYVGCGMGSLELTLEVMESRRSDPEWNEDRQREHLNRISPERYCEILQALDIEGAVESSPAGVWVVFQKPYPSSLSA